MVSNLLSTRAPRYYEGVSGTSSRSAGSFYSLRELECKLGVQKLLDVFNLEFPIPIRSNLDDQSRFIDERYADGGVCVIGGLERTLGGDRELKGITTDMDEHLPGHLGHGMDIDLTGGSELRLNLAICSHYGP